MFIIALIITLLLVSKIIVTYNSTSSNKSLDLIILYITQCFFFLGTVYNNLRFLIFIIFLILTYRGQILFRPLYSYYLFIIWGIITLIYTDSISFGVLMIVKFIIPLFFLMYAYNAINNEDDFITILKRTCYVFPFFILVSIYPLPSLGSVTLPIFSSWSAKGCDLFSVLICVPLALYILYNERKYLYLSIFFLLPPFTLIRRAAIAASLISIGVFYFYKKGIKAIVPIIMLALFTLSLILCITPLKNRFFGGDKGDVSHLSNKELISSTEHISSSGRDFMWKYALAKYYKKHEVKGCGLGTMKVFLRNDKKTSQSFAMLHNDHLHILIETGIIGLALWIITFLKLIISMIQILIAHSGNRILKVSAACALSSTLALLFNMYYANMLSGFSTLPCSFIFIGCFLKLKALYSDRRL